jgi:anaerobic selenocysteine-containing dehydrogenase
MKERQVPMQSRRTICQVCLIGCPLVVVEKGGKTSVCGDKDDPIYRGYSCREGRESVAIRVLPTRLLVARKNSSGEFSAISMPQMAFEIPNKVKSIIAQHGPRSVALYLGTYGYLSQTSFAFAVALIAAIKSPMFFTAAHFDAITGLLRMSASAIHVDILAARHLQRV